LRGGDTPADTSSSPSSFSRQNLQISNLAGKNTVFIRRQETMTATDGAIPRKPVNSPVNAEAADASSNVIIFSM
jgi:hypothetical protein